MTNNENLALLASLADSAPYLVPETTLYAEVCNRLTHTLSFDGFRALLIDHKNKRRIASVASEDGPKWKITDEGFLRLAELH